MSSSLIFADPLFTKCEETVGDEKGCIQKAKLEEGSGLEEEGAGLGAAAAAVKEDIEEGYIEECTDEEDGGDSDDEEPEIIEASQTDLANERIVVLALTLLILFTKSSKLDLCFC